MQRNIQLHLDTREDPLGTIRYERQGQQENATFLYSDQWLSDPKAFNIDPSLQLVTGQQFHKKPEGGSLFHGAIVDTEPDGWGKKIVLRNHQRKRKKALAGELDYKVDVLGQMDYLLAVDDESRVGALRFKDENGVFQGCGEDGERRTPPLLDLDQLLTSTRNVESDTESEQDLAFLQGKGTSLGGMRPKCTIREEDGALALAKFPSISDERPVTKAEILALRLAGLAGINVSEGRIVYSGDLPVAIIKRFDRTSSGQRIPYISAATFLQVEKGDAGEHSYTEIVDQIRVNGFDARKDIEELYRRIAFSIMINNVDDHLHNHGFLYAGDNRWQLSPAFDINPFPDRARELKTWVSEDSGPESSLEELRSAAGFFGLKPNGSQAVMDEVAAAVSQWKNTGRELGMTSRELESIEEAFRYK